MGKKKSSWFTYVKRIFIGKPKPKRADEVTKKPKKWIWFLDKFKFRRYPALEVPHRVLNDASEEQKKHAMAVAIATAAAAEAAVAAANAAAEVVRMTNRRPKLTWKNLQHLAAIKIQTSYRGHLARKALRALKGLVKLQAVIRGELVRRRVIRTLASMSLFTKARPQKRVPTLFDYLNHGENRRSLSRREGNKSEELKLHSKPQKSRNMSLVSKEGREAMYLQKQEAVAQRERMKQYSFSYRERRNNQSPQETVTFVKEKFRPWSRSNSIDSSWLAQLKLKAACKHELIDELSCSPSSQPRRSFSLVRQKSIGGDGSLSDSQIYPAYMAATKSASSKSCRSFSTPKQRLRLCETCSCSDHSPHKLHRLSSWSSESGN